MENIAPMAVIASILVSSIAFLAAIFLLKIVPRINLQLTLLVAFAAGALVGDVFLHLLPELVSENEFTTELSLAIIAGITASLIIEAGIHCYNGRHDHDHIHIGEGQQNSALPYLSLLSDGLHNLLDGVSIAAAFLISPAVGGITTLAIIFHEIPQELADVGILIRARWSARKVLLANASTALTATAGVVITLALADLVPAILPGVIAFAIGQLIYVALADLLPEIHHRTNLRTYILEISTFVLAIGIMWTLTLVE